MPVSSGAIYSDSQNGECEKLVEIQSYKTGASKFVVENVLPREELANLEENCETNVTVQNNNLLLNQKPIHNMVLENKKCDRQKTFDGHLIYRLGERGSGTRARSQIQNFHSIQNECLQSNSLFEDPDFPADNSSIMNPKHVNCNVKWLRPPELIDDPQFFVKGYSRFDVKQGQLHNCWFIAATANLTMNRKLFGRVVPEDQSFRTKYAGIFHFRFWQYGKWVDVVIDDRLPTIDGELIFMSSIDTNEFWSALFEKAYAKLHGSYGALNDGNSNEAMEDFTGGVTESIDLKQSSSNLFSILLKAHERNSMIACNITPDPNKSEKHTSEGLIMGHAYSITKVQLMDTTKNKIKMIRLRNPWGNEIEWTGPWCDKSTEWNDIPEHVKMDIGLTFDNDGEFWMSLSDFVTHFNDVEICNLSPSSLSDEQISQGTKKWEISTFEGQWKNGVTAGGCNQFIETFWLNPQYVITLADPDENDDEAKCTMICTLSMKTHRNNQNNVVLFVGFAIYPVSEQDLVKKPLKKEFFANNNDNAVDTDGFYDFRQVTRRFKLLPGKYIIVPSTSRPNVDGEFIIRVFSECKNKMEENDEQICVIEPNYASIKLENNLYDSNSKTFEQLFINVAGDDGEVDWMELKRILDSTMKDYVSTKNKNQQGFIGMLWKWICKFPLLANYSDDVEQNGFSKDVCRSMVAMMDLDKSGKLDIEQFRTLMNAIHNWREVFKKHDQDYSGYFDAAELRTALNSVGYQLNNRVLNALFHRYGSRDGMVYFDDFLMCAIKMKTMINLFNDRDVEGINLATFNMEEWIENTIYS